MSYLVLDLENYPGYALDLTESQPRVWSYKRNRHLKPSLNHFGYYAFNLQRGVVTLHSLVASVILGPRQAGMTVNHIDGNKLNNRPENLEYCTIAENIAHSMKMGLHVSHHPENHRNWKGGISKRDRKAYKAAWYQKKKLEKV